MDKTKFGRKLHWTRRNKKITSEELASQIGLNASYIRQIECGNKQPSVDTLIKICNALEVSPAFLLEADLKIPKPEKPNKKSALMRRAER